MAESLRYFPKPAAPLPYRLLSVSVAALQLLGHTVHATIPLSLHNTNPEPWDGGETSFTFVGGVRMPEERGKT